MKLRSGLFGASLTLALLGSIGTPDAGLFAPVACVSPAVLIGLTALPTDAIGNIAQERIGGNTDAN